MFQIKGSYYFLLLAILFLGSCAAYMLDSAQTDLRSSFAKGDFQETANLLSDFEKKEVYENKDRVLLLLEQGTINHFAGNYKESNSYFESAEYEIEDLFTKSITRAIQSFVINDNKLAYDGEDYEDIYLNVFKTLNYIHLDDLEGALVEARRVSYKLGELNTKYNGLVEALAKADTSGVDPDKWKTGETNIQNSAMGHYLSTILFAKTGKPDDARISYNNLLKSYSDQPSVYNFKAPASQELMMLTEPGSYNVLVSAFTGRSPIKEQNDIRFYWEPTDSYFKFSLPGLVPFDSEVGTVKIVVNSQFPQEVSLIENMDLVAQEVYKVKEPIIYARSLVRSAIKTLASDQARNRISEENEALGSLFNIVGKLATEATEKADLRSWQTMPGKAHATILNLPEGEHFIEIQYFNNYGNLLFTDLQTIMVSEQENLELIESIYWN
ncbi:MAG: hypothetical protein MI700_13005 [Balneolales bacterium]|nr:hypothetical protein [Balneolales bacterium]